MPSSYTYDRNIQRYRGENGRFVSAKQIEEITQSMISEGWKAVDGIGDKLIDGELSLGEWTAQTAFKLKETHIQQYLLGRGGLKSMTPRDYGIIGAKLKKEYAYLNGFAKSIRDDEMSIEQFKARLKLYLNSTNSSYELGRRESHSKNGFIFERRRLNAGDNCSPCISYAALNWVAIGTLPAIASECDCKANCNCFFEYSKEEDKPDTFSGRRFGWIGDRFRA